jgi:hypothetical protein
MVAATQGYPFLIQLVGDQVWRKATGEGEIGSTCPAPTLASTPPADDWVSSFTRRRSPRPQTSTSPSCWQCPPTKAPRRCATSKHASEWTRTTRASTGCACSRWSLSNRLAARPSRLRAALPTRLPARARRLTRPHATHQQARDLTAPIRHASSRGPPGRARHVVVMTT